MGFEEFKPTIVMVGMQFIYAGTTLFVKAALLEEMSSAVFVVYRQCIAFLLMAPFAFFSRGSNGGGCMNWKSLFFIFLLSFVGVTANQNLSSMGLSLVSSSVTSAMFNLAPAITFLMAYTFGLEKIKVRSWGSMAKMVGTVVCVCGAAALALLKGPKLLNTETTLTKSQGHHEIDNTWLLGCLLSLGSSCCWSGALILQVKVNKIYPDAVSLTAWMCLMATFQCGIFAFIVEYPNTNAWKLTSPLQIIACFYAGIVSAVAVLAQTWCVAKRGPLFSSVFQPLCTLIVTLFGSFFLHEDLYLGSLIGGAAVISGLYLVLWGKARVYKEELCPSQVSNKIDLKEPLLKHVT